MPTVPVAVAALDITGADGFIVIVNVFVPAPPAFVALSVTLEVPVVVGVPLITPVDVFTLKPAGKPVAP